MTLDEALDLPFDDYIAWCHNYIYYACTKDPILSLILESTANHGGPAFLEAQWAKRYWFARCRKLETSRAQLDAATTAHDALSTAFRTALNQRDDLRTQLEELRAWIAEGETLQMEFLFAPTALGLWWARRPKDST